VSPGSDLASPWAAPPLRVVVSHLTVQIGTLIVGGDAGLHHAPGPDAGRGALEIHQDQPAHPSGRYRQRPSRYHR